ncbi:hypothetical protein PAAG_12112 [Paracoccidioides lutzii Pb01]|uniref:Uncharacterized protein n=1 Tax=Paracoccidioides lutzii (strain ATCC MYA-826 / Pb01) TaxID=502779 RepID=A0A0A2V132_PARBA|nr:hypothetical protein PAAG_12112 [Paracoccidioides lutzii Pb01]KGQ01168.1 hypothetical protein PAAG_12112 [Paracoccidioides lutzii Pb01]
MFYSSCSLILALALAIGSQHSSASAGVQYPLATNPELTLDGVPFAIRAYWMRRANQALSDLGSPCPFAAFGTVIVNHTKQGELGDLICIGVNENSKTGNPTSHGKLPFLFSNTCIDPEPAFGIPSAPLEQTRAMQIFISICLFLGSTLIQLPFQRTGEIAAITNCTKVLTHKSGRFKMTPSQALNAFKELTLYTNAESCSMCTSAIRWAGFKEYVYGSSIESLIRKGWSQIRISSQEIIERSYDLPSSTILIGEILANETDPYFAWQYDPSAPCPAGCSRSGPRMSCRKSARRD